MGYCISMNNNIVYKIKGIKISADDIVLDLGTKDGSVLEDCPGTVIGIDINSSQFPSETKTELLLGDGRQLPFDANVFDYVYCSVVLEHVDGSKPLIAEAARVLKPSGTAFFGFPNRISLLQPHNGIPRYYSLFPKPIGQLVAPYLLSEVKTEYYERALFPLTPLSARRHLHSHFDKVEYTMQVSGEHVTDNSKIQKVFRLTNRILLKRPFKYLFELLWPNATYHCKRPKD